MKYGAPKPRKQDEDVEEDLEKFNRNSGETRIAWVSRILSENGAPGKPLRNTIKNINCKVNEDLDALGVKPRRMSLEPNPLIQFMSCHYYQSGICNQIPINGTHSDRNTDKRAYVHSCAICVRFLKCLCPHAMINCDLIKELDQYENDQSYSPMLFYKPEQEME